VLIRHARSTANVDPGVYATTPDHLIPLACPVDDLDALAAGDLLRTLALDAAATCSWTSSFLRCLQTESLVMARAFGAARDRIERREAYLLREREYGDWDGLTEAQLRARDPERLARREALATAHERFFFRYPNGESHADVVQRMAVFIAGLHRSRYAHHVLFVHGITQRAFRMAWFDRTIDWMEKEPNPPNASLLAITRTDDGEDWQDRYLAVLP
jgi:broad specificity phosphatase PhoE